MAVMDVELLETHCEIAISDKAGTATCVSLARASLLPFFTTHHSMSCYAPLELTSVLIHFDSSQPCPVGR